MWKCDRRQWGIIRDPTEGALLVRAKKVNLDLNHLATTYPRTGTVPFSNELQYMATLHRIADSGEHIAVVKGAVERVLELCASPARGAFAGSVVNSPRGGGDSDQQPPFHRGHQCGGERQVCVGLNAG